MRYQGRLHNWQQQRGFGMITPVGGGEPAFVHQRDFQRLNHQPRNGDLLSYNVSRDPQGRLNAHAIRQLSVRHRLSTRPGLPVRRPRHSTALPLVFSMLLAGSILLGHLPAAVAAVYLFFSLLSYLVYARDKRAAQYRRWRTRESTLHLLALLGGWPGAWLAQQRLRHKSSKTAFRIWFHGSIAANLGLLAWLHYALGI